MRRYLVIRRYRYGSKGKEVSRRSICGSRSLRSSARLRLCTNLYLGGAMNIRISWGLVIFAVLVIVAIYLFVRVF